MSINGQGHSLTLVKGHSDFEVKCLTFGLYTQVSDSGPLGPLVFVFLCVNSVRRLQSPRKYLMFTDSRLIGFPYFILRSFAIVFQLFPTNDDVVERV